MIISEIMEEEDIIITEITYAPTSDPNDMKGETIGLSGRLDITYRYVDGCREVERACKRVSKLREKNIIKK